MTARQAVLEAGHRCAGLFAGQPGLAPLTLPDGFAHREGSFRGAPVALTAVAWAGGAAACARVVTIAGPDLAIVNVLGLPAAPALPILGVDLVAVGEAPIVVVADLSPDPDARHPLPAWGGARPAEGFPPAGTGLPGWCARWFSPAALFTRVPPARLPDALATALDAAAVWAREVTAGAGPPSPRPPTAAARAYCRDHRLEDPGLRLLDHMFGAEWAETFKTGVLFPDGDGPIGTWS